MKISILCFAIFSGVFYAECAKNYKFLSIESCTSDNELVATMTKCEIDGIYISINIDVKQPITKLMVSSLMT